MSNSSKCQEYVELLDAYLDDELDAGERADVQSHLAECAACARQLKEISELARGLKGLPLAKSSREIDFSFLDEQPSVPTTNAVSAACDSYIELLDAYHDGELSSDEKLLTEKHLAECAPCTRRLEEIAGLVKGLKALPKLTLSRDIVGSIDFDSLSTTELIPSSTYAGDTTPRCSNNNELLDAYHDNELDNSERVLVENHLAECAECADRLHAIKRVVADLHSLPQLTAPRDIVGGIAFDAEPVKVSNVVPIASAKSKVAQFAWVGILTAASAVACLIVTMSFKPAPVSTPDVASNKPNPVMSTIAPVKAPEKSTLESPAQLDNSQPAANQNASQEAKTSELAVKPANVAGVSSSPEHKQTASHSDNKVKSQPVDDEIAQGTPHEAVGAENEKNNDSANEVASVPESDGAAGADALGVATDEDGMYDIKI